MSDVVACGKPVALTPPWDTDGRTTARRQGPAKNRGLRGSLRDQVSPPIETLRAGRERREFNPDRLRDDCPVLRWDRFDGTERNNLEHSDAISGPKIPPKQLKLTQTPGPRDLSILSALSGP